MKDLFPALYAVTSAFLMLVPTTARCELTSEVRMHNGAPALYVNGKLTSPTLAAAYRQAASDFNDFKQAGIHIQNLYMRFNWSGPKEYDFSDVDRRMDAYLELDPEGLVLVRVLLTPGEWWCKVYPNDITMRDDGSAAGMFQRRDQCHPSLASEAYRELSREAMRAFVTHMEEEYGDHVVGYQPGNGFGGEWLMFNSFWEVRPGAPPPTRFGVEDYSPVARAGFRDWLRTKYGGKIDQLRRAWNDPYVSFDSAEPPNEIQRYSTTYGIFFDPAAGTRVPDFISYFNDTTARALLENCRWVKELTGGKKIVGVFYGYLWCNFPNLSVNHTGHLGMKDVFRSPDIDFICSPYTYDNKGVGGPNNSQTLPESAMLHGKLYFNEVDTETHLHQRQWRWGDSLHNPENWTETRGLLIRDYGYSLTKAMGLWWTDLRGSNYHDPQIIDLLRRLKQIDEQSLDTDKRLTSEIAVILDEETFKYCGDGEPLFNALLTAQKQWHLGFIGCPWEPYLLSDLDDNRLRDFKLYIFLNTFRVTPEQRDAIHSRLKRNGATAVWVYAPGYIGADKLSVKAMSDLTGIDLVEDATMGELHVDITNRGHPFTAALPAGHAYGTDVDVAAIIRNYDHQIYLKDPRDPGLRRDLPGFRIGPRFYANDAAALVLGQLAQIGRPGLVVKRQDGWTSVYSAAPVISAELLRGIAKASGCHIYSDAGDVVYANREFVCVYSPNGGNRTVRFPQASRVIDLLDDRTIADNADQVEVSIERGSAVLLKLERKSGD